MGPVKFSDSTGEGNLASRVIERSTGRCPGTGGLKVTRNGSPERAGVWVYS